MQDRNKPAAWHDEDAYWRQNFGSRPYTASSPDYSLWEGGYRYGYEAANRPSWIGLPIRGLAALLDQPAAEAKVLTHA